MTHYSLQSRDSTLWQACCEPKYSGRKEHTINEVNKNSRVKEVVEVEEDFGDGPCARCRPKR